MRHPVSTPSSGVMAVRPAIASATAALAGLAIDHIQVDMFGEAVYVNGLAACYEMKQLATRRLAEALPGVVIINELRVAHSNARDSDIARAIRKAVTHLSPDAAARITIEVDGGEVRLRGTVRDRAEAAALEAVAWATLGVRHVYPRMSCAAGAAPTTIERALQEYIARSARLGARAITVRYDSGTVHLTGTVTSAQKREAIEDLVRWHESVADVVNEIRVVAGADAR